MKSAESSSRHRGGSSKRRPHSTSFQNLKSTSFFSTISFVPLPFLPIAPLWANNFRHIPALGHIGDQSDGKEEAQDPRVDRPARMPGRIRTRVRPVISIPCSSIIAFSSTAGSTYGTSDVVHDKIFCDVEGVPIPGQRPRRMEGFTFGSRFQHEECIFESLVPRIAPSFCALGTSCHILQRARMLQVVLLVRECHPRKHYPSPPKWVLLPWVRADVNAANKGRRSCMSDRLQDM